MKRLRTSDESSDEAEAEGEQEAEGSVDLPDPSNVSSHTKRGCIHISE